eukprot:gene43850-63824_t
MPLWFAVIANGLYSDKILGPGHLALVMTFSKCIDIFTDPMMAFHLRSCSMHGIARICAAGACVQSFFFIFIFIPFTQGGNPTSALGFTLGQTGVWVQYALAYIFYFIGDTMTGTPVTTLGVMLKSQRILDEETHDKGLALGSQSKVAGIIVMGIGTVVLGQLDGVLNFEAKPPDISCGLAPWTNFFMAIAVGLFNFATNMRFGRLIGQYKDSVPEVDKREEGGLLVFLEGFSAMVTSGFSNPFFQQLIMAWICDIMALTLTMNLILWFVRHVRGDVRMFALLFFFNGIPLGGEWMMERILLFLVAGETWLNRSDRPCNDDALAQQLDKHTTKFALLKTFIPK